MFHPNNSTALKILSNLLLLYYFIKSNYTEKSSFVYSNHLQEGYSFFLVRPSLYYHLYTKLLAGWSFLHLKIFPLEWCLVRRSYYLRLIYYCLIKFYLLILNCFLDFKLFISLCFELFSGRALINFFRIL